MNNSLCLLGTAQNIIDLIFSGKDLDWEPLYTSNGRGSGRGGQERLWNKAPQPEAPTQLGTQMEKQRFRS